MAFAPKVGVGVGVALIKDGKVLMGRRHEDPEKADSLLHGEGTWTVPGGKLDFGETIADGACRETLEETSIKLDPKDLKLASVGNERVADAHFVTIGFVCENFYGEPKVMEPDEITEWRWFDLKDLPSPMFPPAEKLLKNCLAGKIYQGE
ncbi:MAG: NUDIX domain-containing protein [Patescibacteria group bacterium]